MKPPAVDYVYQKFATYDEAREFAELAREFIGGDYRYFPERSGWSVEWQKHHPDSGRELKPRSLKHLRKLQEQWECDQAETEIDIESRLMEEWWKHFDEYNEDPEYWWSRNYEPSAEFESFIDYWNELWDWSDQ